MAPRSAKVKKTAEPNKLSDSEAVKKGRGKAKTLNDVEPKSAEIEIEEKIAPDTEKKTRGRKGANSRKEQVNGNSEEIVAPARKGRVKKEPTPESNNISQKTDLEDIAENDGSHPETNGTSEVASSNGKGRKKQTKKQTSGQGDSQDVANDKKTAKQESDSELKGRGRKTQSKIEPDSEVKEVKEPASKGRKKAPAKVTKGKDTVVEENDQQETKNSEDVEEKPKKSRGRKNQTKKTKDNVEENEEQPDVDSEHGDGLAAKKIKMNEAESKEDDITEAKPAKGKRVRKAAEVAAEPQEVQDSSSVPKRRRNEEKDQDKKKASPKNNKTTDYDSIDFSNNSKNGQGKEWNFKISSWNVDGIRAWLGKGGLDYIKYEKPDILCLQEVKCSREKLPAEIANVPGYHAYWLCSDQDGYAGVGIYTTKLAMNVQYGLGDEQLDSEGRIITAEYEQFYLICTYVPNAGRKLVTLPKRLQWNDAFRKHVKELDMKKPVIICGDMNVAHNEIDLANPKTNQKNAGFTKEERSGMTELLGDGFVDTFRHFYPDKPKAYTFWTYMMNSRQKNVGWRLDYFIVSEKLRPSLCDNKIREQVYGSDHCPIALFLHLTSADKPKNEI